MLLFYPVISHAWRKKRIVITTSRTYPWSKAINKVMVAVI